MSSTRIGLLVGLVLGAIAAFGGFQAFAVAALFALVGTGVGLVLDGKVDLRGLRGRSADRR